jgi:hypothetical protein
MLFITVENYILELGALRKDRQAFVGEVVHTQIRGSQGVASFCQRQETLFRNIALPDQAHVRQRDARSQRSRSFQRKSSIRPKDKRL